MDPMTIAAIVSAIAGAGLQYQAQSQALKRQQDAAREMQQRQLQAQQQATQVAAKQAQQFDPTVRKQAQDEITQQLTQNYEQAAQPQITAQGVQVGSTVPQAEAGGDYTVAKAREAAKTTESLRQLAALFGRTGGATELRRREAVGFGDAAGAVGRIQDGANNIAGIDQVGVQAAGQPDFLKTIAGAGLQAYGMGRFASAGMGKAPAYGQVQGAASGPTGAWL